MRYIYIYMYICVKFWHKFSNRVHVDPSNAKRVEVYDERKSKARASLELLLQKIII